MSNPAIVQQVNNETYFNNAHGGVANQTTQFASKTAAGNTIISFCTESDFATIWTPVNNDSQSNAFTSYNQQNTPQSGGAATLAMLVATNIAGDPSTADTVTFTNQPTSGNTSGVLDDYVAMLILEVGNVASSPIVGTNGSTQAALVAGTNNVVSGNIVVSSSQVPCLMLAMAYNTSASGSHPTPTAGTGMTQVSTQWVEGSALTCLAKQLIVTAGTYQAVFNQASSTAEDMCCIAVVMQGVSVATSGLGPRLIYVMP